METGAYSLRKINSEQIFLMPQIRLISDLRHFLSVNDPLHFGNILQNGK